MKDVDYSDRAITMRLKRLAQLRKLCLSLAKSNPGNRQPSKREPPTANRQPPTE